MDRTFCYPIRHCYGPVLVSIPFCTPSPTPSGNSSNTLLSVLSGPVADTVVTKIAKRRKGIREAEFGLANMVIPFICGIAGCFVFGYAGQSNVHWSVLLLGNFFVVFGFLCIMIAVNVYIVESYPQWAGPVLVNVSSMRIIIAFFLASEATTWVAEKGLLATFAIYAETMIVISLGIPILWFTGKKLRVWTGGKVKKAT